MPPKRKQFPKDSSKSPSVVQTPHPDTPRVSPHISSLVLLRSFLSPCPLLSPSSVTSASSPIPIIPTEDTNDTAPINHFAEAAVPSLNPTELRYTPDASAIYPDDTNTNPASDAKTLLNKKPSFRDKMPALLLTRIRNDWGDSITEKKWTVVQPMK